jgi:hypothetical protein
LALKIRRTPMRLTVLAVATTSELATFDDALAGAARLAGVVVVD